MTSKNGSNGSLTSTRRGSAPEISQDGNSLFIGEAPASRVDVLRIACALGWPRCTYGRVALEGERAWKSAAMPYAIDRRELMAQLRTIEAGR